MNCTFDPIGMVLAAPVPNPLLGPEMDSMSTCTVAALSATEERVT